MVPLIGFCLYECLKACTDSESELIFRYSVLFSIKGSHPSGHEPLSAKKCNFFVGLKNTFKEVIFVYEKNIFVNFSVKFLEWC